MHRLGQGEPSAPEPIEVREPYCVYPQVSGDGRFLVAITSEVEPRADWIRALPDGEWRPFLLDVDGTCNGVFDGDTYVAVCTEGAATGPARQDPDRDRGAARDVGRAAPGGRARAPIRPAGG